MYVACKFFPVETKMFVSYKKIHAMEFLAEAGF